MARGNKYVTVPEDASLSEVIAQMRATNASVAVVTSQDGQFTSAEAKGMITRKDILDTVADDMELFD